MRAVIEPDGTLKVFCISTDTKPTSSTTAYEYSRRINITKAIEVGDALREIDTKKDYLFNGTAWIAQN